MTLVDSNVLLDVATRTPDWWQWSLERLEEAGTNGPVVINDVVYAEISSRFPSIDVVDTVIRDVGVDLIPMPKSALFRASKVYLRYRAAGGIRTGVLSDFFIGAHAEAEQFPLLTRDVRRYRSYFPKVNLIAPE